MNRESDEILIAWKNELYGGSWKRMLKEYQSILREKSTPTDEKILLQGSIARIKEFMQEQDSNNLKI